jgi:hypothetical protein
MSQAYVIEVHSKTAGIVVRDGREFCFFAATHEFNALEGRVFPSPKEAEKAILRHAAEGRTGIAKSVNASVRSVRRS